MPFERTRVQFTTTGTSGVATIPLKWDVVELIGHRIVSTGDTSTTVQIKEGASLASPAPTIVYLDAATKDYTTAKDTLYAMDDTATGLGYSTGLLDSTGAAATIAGGNGLAARSPIELTWASGTSGDSITADIYYRGPLYVAERTITVPNPAATVTDTFQLRSKFAQVLGFTALASADTSTRIGIADADSRTVYLDAADKDYTTTLKRMTLTYDDTLTGLTPQHLDATGAAATATSAAPLPVVRSPLTVTYSNNATANATLTLKIFYRA